MKMESLQQRREELERKEHQLKESLLKFDKFLKENDSKRARAVKKSLDERELRRGKEKDIERYIAIEVPVYFVQSLHGSVFHVFFCFAWCTTTFKVTFFCLHFRNVTVRQHHDSITCKLTSVRWQLVSVAGNVEPAFDRPLVETFFRVIVILLNLPASRNVVFRRFRLQSAAYRNVA